MLANKGVGVNGVRVLQEATVDSMMSDHWEPGIVNSHIPDVPGGDAIAAVAALAKIGDFGYGIGGNVLLKEGALGPCGKGTFGWLGYLFTEYWVDPEKELTVSFHSQVIWGQFFGSGYEAPGKYLPEMSDPGTMFQLHPRTSSRTPSPAPTPALTHTGGRWCKTRCTRPCCVQRSSRR